jgi:hypothetical protein
MTEDTSVVPIESAPLAISPEVMEQVLIGGDLTKLTPAQRTEYYLAVCKSQGLNPLTKPFEYLNLNGKLRLYPTKDCGDQLRRIRGISFSSITKEIIGDIYVVTAYAKDANGREDVSTGAVNIKGKSGDDLANAYMRAETKSKRRVTLSIAGLGFTDESETDTIPQASLQPPAEKKALASREAKPQDAEAGKRETLLGAITQTLKDSGLDRPGVMQALFDAFRTSGWSHVKALPIADLEAGYARLRVSMQAREVPDFDAPPPTGNAQEAVISPPGDTQEAEAVAVGPDGEVSPQRQTGMASKQQIAGLKLAAQQIDQAAESELQEVLDHYPNGLPLATYIVMRNRLDGRKAEGKAAEAQGALI